VGNLNIITVKWTEGQAANFSAEVPLKGGAMRGMGERKKKKKGRAVGKACARRVAKPDASAGEFVGREGE